MKRLITCMIVCALMLSCVNVVFADEVKEIVIDTDVPVFQDLTDGQSFKGSKDIYIADLSPVDCIVLKKGSGTVSFAGSTFSGYTEVTKKTDLSCINYEKITTVSSEGSYMVYAIDEYGHDIAVRFSITKTGGGSGGGGGGSGGGGSSGSGGSGSSGGSSSGGGGSGFGGGTTPSIPTQQTKESLVKDILECDEHIVYMSGYPGNVFMPDNNMTRAEVAAMFARLMKEKIDENQIYPSDFSDVDASMWFANYIGYMQKYNVITGYEDGTFRPNNSITRAEFVTMACRFVKNINGTSSSFTDIDSMHWAYQFVSFASNNQWVSGYEDGTFKPDNTITRAEAVVIVNRMLLRSADKDYVNSHMDGINQFDDVPKSYWAYYDIMEATTEHNYTKNNNTEIWN